MKRQIRLNEFGSNKGRIKVQNIDETNFMILCTKRQEYRFNKVGFIIYHHDLLDVICDRKDKYRILDHNFKIFYLVTEKV